MTGRVAGRPALHLDFFPEDCLVFIDESHVSVPQIGSMVEATAHERVAR